jgi:hypothetical protein
MHVCGAKGGVDQEGNACAVTQCGLEGAAGWSMGGCNPATGAIAGGDDAGNYNTAGTICCTP